MTEKEIRDLFAAHSVELARNDVWQVQQALVIKHAALERLGAKLGVRWAEPRFLRSERDEAVVLAIGYLTNSEGIDTAREWSVGEAVINVNYRISGKQAAYVYAMAEKRAKDRVILKLANLHGAYSEDEADDFKDAAPRETPKHITNTARVGEPDDPRASEAQAYVALAITAMQNAETPAELDDWWRSESGKRREYGVVKGTVPFDELAAAFKQAKEVLSYGVREAAE